MLANIRHVSIILESVANKSLLVWMHSIPFWRQPFICSEKLEFIDSVLFKTYTAAPLEIEILICTFHKAYSFEAQWWSIFHHTSLTRENNTKNTRCYVMHVWSLFIWYSKGAIHSERYIQNSYSWIVSSVLVSIFCFGFWRTSCVGLRWW